MSRNRALPFIVVILLIGFGGLLYRGFRTTDTSADDEKKSAKSPADRGGHIALSVYLDESLRTVEAVVTFTPNIFPGAGNSSDLFSREGQVGSVWGLYFEGTEIDQVMRSASGIRLGVYLDPRLPEAAARSVARRELCRALPVVVARLVDKYVSWVNQNHTPTDRLIYVPCPAPI